MQVERVPHPRVRHSETVKPAQSTRSVPRLASDVLRSWIVAGASFAIFFAVPFLFALIFDDFSLYALIAASTFSLWAFLALATAVINWLAFRRATGEELARWMLATTPTTTWRRFLWSIQGGGAISWAITGSGIATTAVVFLAQSAELRTEPMVVVPAILAVASSVLMIISAYAVRYARGNAAGGELHFTGTEHPRFVDYFYLAVQISTTFSTSDVTISTSRMRRMVAVHSLIAFTFNTVIVALLVSLLISSVR